MALPTATTIQNLTRCKTLPGFFPGGVRDQLIRAIPFHDVTGYGQFVNVNRAALGAAANYAAGGALAIVPGASPLVQFDFKRIGDGVQVDSADITASEETQEQLRLQVEMKRIAVVRQLSTQLIQGDGVGSNLLGLAASIDAGQTIDPLAGMGTAPTLDDYHRLLGLVSASDGCVGTGPDALVMHPRTRRQLMNRLETAAGGGLQFATEDTLEQQLLRFEGLPVYVSDSVSVAETTAGAQTGGSSTSVYALKLKGPTGLRVLHQGGDSKDFGIVTEEVPPQLSTASRAATVRGYYALLVPEVASAARLKAVDISAFA